MQIYIWSLLKLRNSTFQEKRFMVRRRSLPNCFASDINTDKQAVYDIVGKIFWTQFDCMTKNYRLKMVNSYDSLLHKEFEILTLQHILKIPRYRCTYYNVFRRLHLQHCLSLSQNYAVRQWDKAKHFKTVRLRIVFWILLWITGLDWSFESISSLPYEQNSERDLLVSLPLLYLF